MEYIQLKNKDDLRKQLVATGINVSKWGIDGTKTLGNLWNEIAKGESHLVYEANGRITRVVSGVVEVIIRRAGKILVESEQEFADGCIRIRNRPPVEKMMPEESSRDAVIRCLQKELGVARRNIHVIKVAYKPREEVKDSPSYPELRSRYAFFPVEARVQGLPKTDFETPESSDKGEILIRRHKWAWKREATEIYY